MFSKSLEYTLNNAFSRAREKRHEFITVEHLLLALLDDAEAGVALSACGADIERLRAGLGIFIDETTPHIPSNTDRDIQPTLSFQRILQRAIYQAQTSSRPDITGNTVLAAIFSEAESQAVYFLSQENITRADIVNYATQGITKAAYGSKVRMDPPASPSIEANPLQDNTADENLIELYAVDLNAKARAGRIDPLIGRKKEVMRCMQVLCRRSKNNPLLVGEAGVGKTAIAEGLAAMIVDRKVPSLLRRSTVYSLDLGVLLAGTKYRGDFEKRFKAVLSALSRDTGAIVFIDEIHNLVGAGSATGGAMDAANLIKPLLSSGELRCMGATTYEEFRNFFSKDHALLRRFQKVDVKEPTVEETLGILKGLKSRFEGYHEVTYTDEALVSAVTLSSRYLSDRHLPDKAIDIVDEAGAFQRLQKGKKRKTVIDVAEVEEIIARMASIPLKTITKSDQQLLKDLPRKLKKVVFNQDCAIDALTNSIKLSRAGLRDPNKPIGSFLMTGPTGVGKTEVTRQLAESLGVDLIRFDMSEYMEAHAVSRLIGSPPGYVGFEQGGLLTESVIKSPHSVLLIDEIEKAHPDLFNILLQAMDYGQLTDNNGRKADFRHVIIVMTTNAGAVDLERNSIGFAQEKEGFAENEKILKQVFSPEFRNRLDAIVPFNHLDQRTISKVVEKFLNELRVQLKEKGIALAVNDSAKGWLAKQGYNPSMGARPMARLIQERLKQPIAEELLFGKLMEGSSKVRVSVNDNELDVAVEEVA